MIDVSYIQELISANNVEKLKAYIKEHNIQIEDGMLKITKQQGEKAIEYWDKRQHVRKINLNALYGTLLNAGSRFYDCRLGQSTTLAGRQVERHMLSTINEIITGVYDHEGDAIIYGDTDSGYFSAYELLECDIDNGLVQWDDDIAVNLYDSVAVEVNKTFPDFAKKAFNSPISRGKLLSASREIVASDAIFIKKKRYGARMIDKDGKRVNGKLKIMGLDIRRSDTPLVIQNFLKGVLTKILDNEPQSNIFQYIRDFRIEFKSASAWEKGSPKRVNSLTRYAEKEDDSLRTALDFMDDPDFVAGKARLPGHVRAALNWNMLREMHNDKISMPILDGDKVIVCRLKPNIMGYTSVAYPVDILELPTWFTDLPFDVDDMETRIIDEKLDRLIGILNWDLTETHIKPINTFFNFD